MPIGYLVNVGLLASCTLFALTPPRPRQTSPSNLSFWFGFLANELPFIALYLLVASTLLAIGQGDISRADLDSPGGWVTFAVVALTIVGLGLVAWRGLRAGPAVEHALNEGLGATWRRTVDDGKSAGARRRLPLARILFAPFIFRRRDVQRVRNISYGDAGRRNLLDVYCHRARPSGGPVLVYLHGGAFRIGSKNRGARPLIYRLASHGWVCISANYRLSPGARFPDHLVDVKKVIAWVREHGHEYGADPTILFMAGSSAGGHLASVSALTPNEPAFQPGFEQADTSVTAAISLNGYYGGIETRGPPSSPMNYLSAEAPPFFVIHGDLDTVVLVEDARRFVDRLRDVSSDVVVYAELPGAQHSFDLFHSIRFDTVVDAIEAFTSWVRSRDHACGARSSV